jgi:branched-chain amino acid transport system substrate-binding protein
MKTKTFLLAMTVATVGGTAVAEDYVIGVMSAQSGYLAAYDGPSYAGFNFCIDEMNANGGLNGEMPVQLVVKDTRSDIAVGVQSVQEMLDEGAKFIVASADADPTIAAAQITAADSVPTMTFAGTAPVLTQVGPHVFGSYPADNQQAAVLAAYAHEQGFENVWLVKSPDSAYTLGGPEYFGEAFEALGGSVAGVSEYSLNQPDFSAIVTTIRGADTAPDLIVTWAWEPDFPALIRALRGAGVDTQVMGGDVLDSPTVRGLGDVVDGVVHTSGGFPEEGSAYADFVARFAKETGVTPDNNYYVNGCDIAHMIEDAVAAAGSTDPIAVTAAMAEIEDGEGIMSNYTFKGTDRMPLRDVVIARINDEKKELVLRAKADPETMPKP